MKIDKGTVGKIFWISLSFRSVSFLQVWFPYIPSKHVAIIMKASQRRARSFKDLLSRSIFYQLHGAGPPICQGLYTRVAGKPQALKDQDATRLPGG